jgi:hypothetical protein
MRYRTAGPNVAKQACRTIQAEGAWGQAREEQVQGDIAGPLSVSVIIVEKGPSIQFLNRKKGDDSGHPLGPGGQIPGDLSKRGHRVLLVVVHKSSREDRRLVDKPPVTPALSTVSGRRWNDPRNRGFLTILHGT